MALVIFLALPTYGQEDKASKYLWDEAEEIFLVEIVKTDGYISAGAMNCRGNVKAKILETFKRTYFAEQVTTFFFNHKINCDFVSSTVPRIVKEGKQYLVFLENDGPYPTKAEPAVEWVFSLTDRYLGAVEFNEELYDFLTEQRAIELGRKKKK